MSWPASPINGQQVEITGVLYQFDAAANAWNRVTALGLTTTTDFLQVSNLLVTGNATLGNIGEVKITGGGPDQVISTDGAGNLYWKTEAVSTPAGSNTHIQFNDEGDFGASTNLTFNKSTRTLSVPNLAATIRTAAQPGITSLGTLVSATVTGNVNAGNVNGGNLVGAQFLAGTIVANSGYQPNITGVGQLSNLAVSGDALIAGNLTAKTFYGNIAGNLTGNVSAPGANTQIMYNKDGMAGGDANLTFTNNNLLTVIGNITVGNIGGANRITANYLTGTLTTAAQPTITSVGTLTSLSVLNDIDTQANVTAVTFIGNVEAETLAAGSITSPGGLNQVLYNKGGLIGGSANLKFTGSNQLELVGNIITENADLGNLAVANYFQGNLISSSQPNLTSVGTLSELNVDGNISIANSFITIDDNTFVVGNIIPDGNKVYDLGTTTNRWRDLYLSGQTISLGTTTITASQLGISTGPVQSNGQISTTAVGKPPFKVTSTVRVDNLNVQFLDGYEPDTANIPDTVVLRDSNGSFSANVVSANVDGWSSLAGEVTSSSQPNITSVGNLTTLHVLFDANIDGSLGIGNTIYADLFDGDGANLGNINGANVSEVPNATWATTAANALHAVEADLANLANYAVSNYQPNIREFDSLYSLRVTNSGTGNIISDNADLGNIAKANTFQGNFVGGHSGVFSVGEFSNTSVLYNHNGNLENADSFTYNPLTKAVDIGGAITAKSANLGNTVTANFFTGNGYLLNSINGANVSEVPNANFSTYSGLASVANSAHYAETAGQVVDAIQGNITRLGTLDLLTVESPTLVYSQPVSFTQTWDNPLSAFTAVKVNVNNSNSASGSLLTDLQVNGVSKFKVDKSGTITSTGNLSVQYIAGTLSTAAQPNITSLGNLTVANVTGNLRAGNANLGNLTESNYFKGDGSLLTNVPIAARLANGTSNVNILNDANINFSVNGNANVAVLSSDNTNGNLFAVTGNVTATNANLGNNVSANFFTGNGTTLTDIAGANVSGIVPNANMSAYANKVVANAQPNITSFGTLTSLTVDSTVTSNLGNLAKASYFQGTLTTAAQPNITSVGRLSSLTVGNVSSNTLFGNGTITTGTTVINGANITADAFIGDAGNLSNVTGANVTGKVNNAKQADNATTAGTVTTAAQPNITSVGNLTSLNVAGDTTIVGSLTVQGNTNFVNVTTSAIKDTVIELGAGIEYVVVSSGMTYSLGNVTVVTATPHAVKLNDTIVVKGASPTQYNGSFSVNRIIDAVSFTYAVSPAPATSPATLAVAGSPISVSLGSLTASDGFDRGILMHYYTTAAVDAYMGWDNANSQFVLASNVVTGNNKVALYNSYGNLKVDTLLGNVVSSNISAPGSATNNTQALFNDAGLIGSSAKFVFDKASNVLTVSNIAITSGTVTNANSAFNVTQTWNNSAVTFTAFKQNITDTASNANSLLVDLQVGGSSKFSVRKDGGISGTLLTASQTNVTGLGNVTVGTWSANSISTTYTDAKITNVIAGTGITLANTSGAITVTNNGVRTLTQGSGLTSGGTANDPTIAVTYPLPVAFPALSGANKYLRTDPTNGTTLIWQDFTPPPYIANGTSNVNIPIANGNINISANGKANILQIGDWGINTVGTMTAGVGSGGNISGANNVIANYFYGNFGTPNAALQFSSDTQNVIFKSGAIANTLQLTGTGAIFSANITTGGTGVGGNLTGANVIFANTFVGAHGNGTSNLTFPASGGNAVFNIGGALSAATITSAGITVGTGSNGAINNANIITANWFYGSHANGTSNINMPAINGNITFTVAGVANVLQLTSANAVFAGNVVTGATGVGGNITGANVIIANTFIGVHGNGTSNVSIPTASGNVTISAGGAANVLTVTPSNVTVGTGSGGNITSANNIIANTFIGVHGNGTSNVSIPTASGNVAISVAGVANVLTVNSTGVQIGVGSAGNITGANVVSANSFVGNLVSGVSNARFLSSGGNLVVGVGGTDMLTVASTGTVVQTKLTIGSGAGGDLTGANNFQANNFVGNTLAINGFISFKGSQENIVYNGVIGTYDLSQGTVFMHTNTFSGAFTVTFNNLPAITSSDSKSIAVSIILVQGATPGIPSSVIIAGTTYTIKWLYGVAPLGLANAVDVFTISIIRVNGAVNQILGSYTTYK